MLGNKLNLKQLYDKVCLGDKNSKLTKNSYITLDYA